MPDDADPEFRIEENSSPGTGPVGAALEAAIEEANAVHICWACPSGTNQIIAVNGSPVRGGTT
jgi:hypothetical protein